MQIQQQRHGEIPINCQINPLPEIHGNIDVKPRPQHILHAGDKTHHTGNQGYAEQSGIEPVTIGQHRGKGYICCKSSDPHQNRGHAVKRIVGKNNGDRHIGDIYQQQLADSAHY